jgi:hypothetical protein
MATLTKQKRLCLTIPPKMPYSNGERLELSKDAKEDVTKFKQYKEDESGWDLKYGGAKDYDSKKLEMPGLVNDLVKKASDCGFVRLRNS